MCAILTSMYSCVQLSYSLWKPYFLVLLYHPWHVQSFCLFSHNDSWAFGRWCNMHVPSMNKNSTVSYCLYFYKLWVSVIITMYYKIGASLALLSIFGCAVQETPKIACCWHMVIHLREEKWVSIAEDLMPLQILGPQSWSWTDLKAFSPWSSFHGIKRLHASFQRRKATNSPTQLWHIWTM